MLSGFELYPRSGAPDCLQSPVSLKISLALNITAHATANDDITCLGFACSNHKEIATGL